MSNYVTGITGRQAIAARACPEGMRETLDAYMRGTGRIPGMGTVIPWKYVSDLPFAVTVVSRVGGRADLSGADLYDADLSRADLSGTNLIGTNLSEATVLVGHRKVEVRG